MLLREVVIERPKQQIHALGTVNAQSLAIMALSRISQNSVNKFDQFAHDHGSHQLHFFNYVFAFVSAS
jgi:hypothetical protein